MKRAGADEPLAPAVVEAAERAVGLAEAPAAAALRSRQGEVGKALDLGQVHALVGEGAPREFAGLGGAEAGEGAELREHRSDDRPAAMNMQLGHVLAGETRRPRKEQHQPAIDRFHRLRHEWI